MSQKRALIFHGTMGSPDGNWFPWLKESLENNEWNVLVPTFPTPNNQNLENWLKAFKEQVSDSNNIDLLVGHSLGATFILRLLEQGLCCPKKIILVSPVYDLINIPDYDTLNASFIGEFDWKAINKNVKTAYVLHGDNDPYVPLDQAYSVADGLGISLELIKDGGHLNLETGYDQLPRLLELINVE
ncbi:MAG: alpha/beta hydrolase [Pseudomonadota bacterium]